jgi:hypothetical protein
MRLALMAGGFLIVLAVPGSGEQHAGGRTAARLRPAAGRQAATGPCQPAPVRGRAPPALTEIPGVPTRPHPVRGLSRWELVAFFFVHPNAGQRPGRPSSKVLWVVGRRVEAAQLAILRVAPAAPGGIRARAVPA